MKIEFLTIKVKALHQLLSQLNHDANTREVTINSPSDRLDLLSASGRLTSLSVDVIGFASAFLTRIGVLPGAGEDIVINEFFVLRLVVSIDSIQ